MFNLFKKKEPVTLYSPVSGKSIPIEEVPDKVFASKMMGDGVAFQFDGNTVYAPCDATISMIANTLHAIGLKLNNGAEVLIHIGLDTVNLNGKGFTKLVNQSDKVKRGTPLIEIDRSIMEANGIDLTMPMVITNGSEYTFQIENNSSEHVIMNETKLVEFK